MITLAILIVLCYLAFRWAIVSEAREVEARKSRWAEHLVYRQEVAERRRQAARECLRWGALDVSRLQEIEPPEA